MAADLDREASDRLREQADTPLAALAGTAVVAGGTRVGAVTKDADRGGWGTCAAIGAGVRVAFIIELANKSREVQHRIEAE